jgi:hypothetical protein
LLADEAGLSPEELRDWLRAEIERRQVDEVQSEV